MRYYIGRNSVTNEIHHVVSCHDNWNVVRQAEVDGLLYEEVTQVEFRTAYPFPRLFKFVGGRVVANDNFPDDETEITLPDLVADGFDTDAPVPDHVTIKRKTGGTVLKQATRVITQV